MSSVPCISIVTPSYNQAPYLEQTIRSVIEQDYPHIEYIIMDGGSTDGSVEIIQKYADQLVYWESGRDAGQADALRKGFERASGEIFAYLNADDVYLPNIFPIVVDQFRNDVDLSLLHGDLEIVDPSGHVIGTKSGLDLDFWNWFPRLINPIMQPSSFWRASVYEHVGGIDPAYHVAMDYDLWTRIGLGGFKIEHIPIQFSQFRIHPESKTSQHTMMFAEERLKIVDRYFSHSEFKQFLIPHKEKIYSNAYLHLANAAWVIGQDKAAQQFLKKSIITMPRIIFSSKMLNLLIRMLLRKRSIRPRMVDKIKE